MNVMGGLYYIRKHQSTRITESRASQTLGAGFPPFPGSCLHSPLQRLLARLPWQGGGADDSLAGVPEVAGGWEVGRWTVRTQALITAPYRWALRPFPTQGPGP